MIALLCNNIEQFRKHFPRELITTLNESLRIIRLKDGREYMAVLEIADALGWKFDGYEKARCYESLEDIVKTRIR